MRAYLIVLMPLIFLVLLGCNDHGVKIKVDQADPIPLNTDPDIETDTGSATEPDTVDTVTATDTGTGKSICGNGILEVGEFCDDGNELDSDGCYADCLSQDPAYDCSTAGQECEVVSECGNGILESTEQCDEGAGNETGACLDECTTVLDGWSCVFPGKPCVELPVCGDGVREKGEQCDDGNVADGDGCSAACAQSEGYRCIPGQLCVALVCGDGNRTLDEECDDGNMTANDGCSTTCTVESGYRCSSLGCKPICGDSLVVGVEACDDGNRSSGDGCNALCQVEPYFVCSADQPSVCGTTIACGNGKVEPGEVCDPAVAGHELCFDSGENACKGFENNLVVTAVCGNGVIESPETCDGDGGQGGCDDTTCTVEAGFLCPKANYCYPEPVCGDGSVQAGEACDDNNTDDSDGCSSDCVVEANWYCVVTAADTDGSNCVESVCGDGVKAPDEQCDDGDTDDNDGCSATCTVEGGWVCPPDLGRCITDCGNGALDGDEECDDGIDSEGCTNCKIDPGYDCDTNGCYESQCPNNIEENGEGCDDGNTIAGDGCGPTCQLEPAITVGPNPVVELVCGDGLKTEDEECDDGNIDDGDGCSADCQEEDGWGCTDQWVYPEDIEMKIVYRDFMQRTRPGGHPHMKNPNGTIPYWDTDADAGIVGAVCESDTDTDCARLDMEGKPSLDTDARNVGIYGQDVDTDTISAAEVGYNADAFALWYRDTNGDVYDADSDTLVEILANPATMPTAGVDTLVLAREGAGTTADPYQYVFESSGNVFYPLGTTGEGPDGGSVDMRGFGCTYAPDDSGCGEWGTDNEQRNFHFTSELRYFFQYQGGETLTFFGDDDVWVFVNGRLAVDIGGIHSQLWGRVVLGDDGAGADTASSCSVHGADTEPAACALEPEEADPSDTDDTRFGLERGGVYEIVVFQAERHPVASNYRLTLEGFVASRSNCETTCGDGIVAGTEICDEGAGNTTPGNDVYGQCNHECTFTYCGDGDLNTTYETCDDGASNTALPWYVAQSSTCTPGCETPAWCGDGIVQSAYEVCDDGTNDNSYDGCAPGCQSLGPYCGDGSVNGVEEECDPSDGLFVTYQADGFGCGLDCKFAPFCGDGIRNGTEDCDGSAHCGDDCTYIEYCGDGLKAPSEECDFGEFGFDASAGEVYGSCSLDCTLGPYCGDGELYPGIEECDNGAENADNVYGACTTACILGPRCGDGVLQTEQGEYCDNGFNEDTYRYEDDACGPNCTALPFCGDGIIQENFEACDNGAENNDATYNGCNTSCDWGPYCGDGIVQEAYEVCDAGSGNVAYSVTTGGCGYDCRPAPYCGDGVRNGLEECDLGTDANVGGYNGCNPNCSLAPFCGDYVVSAEYGEECDAGPIGSLGCYVDCTLRLDIE